MGSLPRILAALLVLVLSFSIPILLNFVRSPPSILLFLRSLCSPFSFFSFLSLFSSFFLDLLSFSLFSFSCPFSFSLLALPPFSSLLSFILARDIDCLVDDPSGVRRLRSLAGSRSLFPYLPPCLPVFSLFYLAFLFFWALSVFSFLCLFLSMSLLVLSLLDLSSIS